MFRAARRCIPANSSARAPSVAAVASKQCGFSNPATSSNSRSKASAFCATGFCATTDNQHANQGRTPMVYRIRRVVTGHDTDGRSKIIMDSQAPNVLEMASMPGVALTDLWRTATSPASNEGNADAAEGQIKLEPPSEGTILRIVEFPPDTQWRQS